MAFVMDVPGLMLIVPDEGEMLKPGALTSSARLVVAVAVPEAPVMVKRYDPRTAELLTFSVNTLLPFVGFVPNDAVTPLGRPETDKSALSLNPALYWAVMTVVPEAPGEMVRLLGETES